MLYDEFIEEQKVTKALGTAITYRQGLVKFKEYLGDKNLLDFEVYIDYPLWLARQDLSKNTKLSYFAGIEQFVEWLLMKKHLSIDYLSMLRFKKAKSILNSKRESKLPKTPNVGVIDKILEQVKANDDSSIIAKRNIAIIEVLRSTGCRISEITGLKVKHISDDTAIVTGKGSKERYVYLTKEAQAALLAYWNIRGYMQPNQPAFCRHDQSISNNIVPMGIRTIQNLIRDLCIQAGLEHITPHQFRHNFATEALHKTGNLALVQDLLGHADPKSTRVYAKIRSDELRKGHSKIFDTE